MLAFESVRHVGVPLEAQISAEPRLSQRSAMVCLVGLSLLAWAAVLLPLWAMS